MSKILLPLLLVVFSQFGLPTRAEEPADKRLRFLASSLDNNISELDKGEVALPFLLDTVAALASPPGADRDPSKRVTIVLNVDVFSEGMKESFDPERVQIKFSTKLVDVHLATVLRLICDQLDAGYMVRHDYIEILPLRAMRKELDHPFEPDCNTRRLVFGFYEKVSPKKALGDLAHRYDRTFIFSTLAEKELEKPFSARLVNVPFETAVETLADLADLKIVRKSNVYFVTTKEQAATLNAEHEKFLKAEKEQDEKEKAKDEKLQNAPKQRLE